MEKFQFNRFLNVLKWYLQVNRNQLLAWMAGTLLCVFAGEMGMLWIASKSIKASSWTPFYPEIVNGISFAWFIGMLILLLFIQTTIFSRINDKRFATTFLTLPASNAEKYAVLFIYVFLINPVCIFLAYTLGDTLRMLVMPLFSSVGMVSYLPHIVGGIHIFTPSDSPVTQVMGYFTLFSCIVWVHSMYITAGAGLRKHAFFSVSLALVLFATIMAYLFPSWVEPFTWDIPMPVIKTIVWFCILCGLIWAAFNYRLSYRIFKNYQVINNKKTNL